MTKGVWQHLREATHIDLRFDTDVEAAYKAHVEQQLLINSIVFLCSGGFLVGGLIMQTAYEQIHRDDHPWSLSENDPRNFRIFGGLCTAGVLCVGAALCFARLRWNVLRKLDWEAVVVGCVVLAVATSLPNRTHTMCAWYKVDCHDLWGEDTSSHEAMYVLALDVTVTATHLFLPIRTIRLWCVDVAVIGLMVFLVAASGGPFSVKWSVFTIVVLAFLAALAFMGSWRFESNSRKSWMAELQVALTQSELTNMHDAVRNILERLCDSLVILDHTFEIVHPSPRFAAWLLCQRDAEFRNCSFLHYLASKEDTDRFIESLQKHRRDAVVTVTLRDIYGRALAVAAHHTSFQEAGHFYYMVGLVESGEPCQSSEDIILETLSMQSNDVHAKTGQSFRRNVGQGAANIYQDVSSNGTDTPKGRESEESSSISSIGSNALMDEWTRLGLGRRYPGSNVVVDVTDSDLKVLAVLSCGGTTAPRVKIGMSIAHLFDSSSNLCEQLIDHAVTWIDDPKQHRFPRELGTFDLKHELCAHRQCVAKVLRFVCAEDHDSVQAVLCLEEVCSTAKMETDAGSLEFVRL